MASLFTHPAVPLAISIGLGARIIPPRLLLVGLLGCLLPDADVIAYRLGVPYESAFAHRGFTHSIFFALLCGTLAAVFAARLHTHRWVAFAFVSVATASHGLLDALTTGGAGIAFFWPFGDERYFMPPRIILVSPIGFGFFSARGVQVLLSEFKTVWVPCFLVAGLMCFTRGAWINREKT